MKLSLSWLCDHIDVDWRKIDIQKLVNLFNKTTAEIEGFDKIAIDLTHLTAAQVQKVSSSGVIVEVPEWNQTIQMPVLPGAEVGHIYLVAKEGSVHAWARLSHLGSEKEDALPAFAIGQADLKGNWKKAIEERYYSSS